MGFGPVVDLLGGACGAQRGGEGLCHPRVLECGLDLPWGGKEQGLELVQGQIGQQPGVSEVGGQGSFQMLDPLIAGGRGLVEKPGKSRGRP
jgi:hypothetical protein